jgi:cytochrome oxidase Cu insertion factor (SCO1/SenC/PrrC family)
LSCVKLYRLRKNKLESIQNAGITETPRIIPSKALSGCATTSPDLLKTPYGEEVFPAAPLPAEERAKRSPYQTFEGYFPNVRLTTSDGRVVRFHDDLLKGKNVLINFMYTQCTGI